MSSERLLNKLHKSLENKDYYESHQIYRTLYYRLLRDKRHTQLSELLLDGALRLLKSGQHNSGADLASLYLQLLIETNNKTANEKPIVDTSRLLTNIRELFELIPAKSPERLTFVTNAVKLGFVSSSAVRRQFAVVLWREKNFAESRQHFVYSSDSGLDCALMLVEYQTTLGYPSEVDLFIGQFVLQVLCVRNKSMADQTFHAYTSRHPSINSPNPPFLLPLLNFLWFLLLAIDRYVFQTTLNRFQTDALFSPTAAKPRLSKCCATYTAPHCVATPLTTIICPKSGRSTSASRTRPAIDRKACLAILFNPCSRTAKTSPQPTRLLLADVLSINGRLPRWSSTEEDSPLD